MLISSWYQHCYSTQYPTATLQFEGISVLPNYIAECNHFGMELSLSSLCFFVVPLTSWCLCCGWYTYQICAGIEPTLVTRRAICCIFSETNSASFPLYTFNASFCTWSTGIAANRRFAWVLFNHIVWTSSTLHVLQLHRKPLKLLLAKVLLT